jgi:hypothetical protein
VKIKKKRFNFCDLEQGKPFFCSWFSHPI